MFVSLKGRFSYVSSKGETLQCQNCLKRGNNKISYKTPTVTPVPKTNKKIGRPKLNPELTNCIRGGKGLKEGVDVLIVVVEKGLIYVVEALRVFMSKVKVQFSPK